MPNPQGKAHTAVARSGCNPQRLPSIHTIQPQTMNYRKTRQRVWVSTRWLWSKTEVVFYSGNGWHRLHEPFG